MLHENNASQLVDLQLFSFENLAVREEITPTSYKWMSDLFTSKEIKSYISFGLRFCESKDEIKALFRSAVALEVDESYRNCREVPDKMFVDKWPSSLREFHLDIWQGLNLKHSDAPEEAEIIENAIEAAKHFERPLAFRCARRTAESMFTSEATQLFATSALRFATSKADRFLLMVIAARADGTALLTSNLLHSPRPTAVDVHEAQELQVATWLSAQLERNGNCNNDSFLTLVTALASAARRPS